MEQQDRILGYFLEEADEHLDTIEQGLRKLSETVRQPEMIRELFRAAHSIVGSAAMLGLTDVQQIGKQFEANFKLLKDQPIPIDNRLQSLFLESFAFLRAAIVEVKTSSDPYHRNPDSLPPVGDPVFEELKSYLQNLLAQIDSPTPAPVERNLTQDPAIEQVFGEYVTRKLHELQEMCLQPDRSENRAQIQQICQKLGNLGENFEFLEWTNLFAACRLAIANPLNSLHQLGESIVIAVKQSQLLVLADRHQAISITPDLQALIDRKATANLDFGKDASTFKLNNSTDPVANPDPTLAVGIVSALPNQHQDLQSANTRSNGMSIGEELADLDFDNDFADWMSESESEVNSDLELAQFINLLGEDMPVDGTWMQDEDISDDTLNRSDIDNLAIDHSSISEPQHGSIEPVSLRSDPLAVIEIDDTPPIVELPIAKVDYDEETFYDPELEDIDLATFWSDLDSTEKDLSLNHLNDLDFLDGDRQLKPEHPPSQDFDIAAPDFTLDSPMSELFPSVITADQSELEVSELEIAAERVESLAQPLSPQINVQTPLMMDLTSNPLFFEDFDSLELSISETSSVDDELTGWSDKSLDPDQIDDFAGLNLDLGENLDVMTDIPIDHNFDDLNLVATNKLDSITDTAIPHGFMDLNLDSGENLDVMMDVPIDRNFDDLNLVTTNKLDSITDVAIPHDFMDLNLDSGEDLDGMMNVPIDRNFDDLNLVTTNKLDSITDVAIPHDFIDLNLDSGEDLDGMMNVPIDRNFDDLNLVATNKLDSITDTAIPHDFIDLNLDSGEDLDVMMDVPIDRNFDDLNLVATNKLDSITDAAIPRDFMDLDLGSIDQLDSIADPVIVRDFTDFNLAHEDNLDLFANLNVNSDSANSNLEHVENLDLFTDPNIEDHFSDFNLQEINKLDSVLNPGILQSSGYPNDSSFNDFELEDNIDTLDSIADISIESGFPKLTLQDVDSATDLSLDSGFVQLNLENIVELDFIETPALEISLDKFNLTDINDLESVTELTVNSDFTDFNLEDISELDLVAEPNGANSFYSLDSENIHDFDSISDLLNDSLMQIDSLPETIREQDFLDLNLETISSAKIQSLGNVDLSVDISSCDFDDFDSIASTDNMPFDIGNSKLGAEIEIDRDFADLNLAGIGDLNLSSDLNFQLGDISDLDVDLSSHQLLDLEQIVGNNLEQNFSELGNLDSLLLGTAAMGIGGGLLSTAGSEFEDLDALIGISTPESSFSDLDSLLTPAQPLEQSIVPKNPKKAADRRSKQRTFEQTMRVSVRHLNNLNNLVGELVVNRNTLEQDQNRMRQFIEKLFSEVQKLNDVGKRMQDLYERSLMENSLIASRQQSKAASTNQSQINAENLDSLSFMEYDPLEMDRFTPIHLLSQKMIELTVRIRESTSDIEFVVDGSTEVTRTLRQITGQLQEDLTKSRMIPFAQTADRLQRGVRENGLKYGKQVELSIEGRDTLIDKVILESLTDPLIHMVNNAIAHGIESPQTRQEFDKSPVGNISIRAIHQGNQTIISVSDDGAGINTEIVKLKAIQKGIITPRQAATMTKSEVYELLFLPSFSTKDQADELAGRGVGMDVVRTSLAEIRGTISTESQIGLGSTFTIRLPLALSIAKALIAVDNKTNIAFPMDGIEDTQDVSPEQIQKNNQGENCIFWRDGLMPFQPLSELLGFNRPLPRNNFYSSQEDDTDLVSILILRSDGNLLAVQVDKITGEQEIAIKPLQGPASKPVGIAGATVMGDGRIIPIADVMELIDLAKGKITRHISTKWSIDMPTATTQRQESMVLIVDDSITVRELLSLTFKRAGYRVEQARDGQEAWDKLRAGLPCDIVFCDIEMPRMDGLEFLSRVQKDPALSKVPVAMLTSRGSDRHRQIASQLGASGYFIKPYLEEALLHAAKRMIEGEVLAIV